MLEETVRFHIMSINEGRDPEIGSFSDKTNTDRLTDALTTLRQNYEACRAKAVEFIVKNRDNARHLQAALKDQQDDFYLSENEPEFQAYDLLLQLETDGTLEIQQKVEKFPLEILLSKEIKFALRVVSAVRDNNYVQFFNLLNEADYLTACVMSLFIKRIRVKAIDTLIRAIKLENDTFTVSELLVMLGFQDTIETEEFMRTLGLDESSNIEIEDDTDGTDGNRRFNMRKEDQTLAEQKIFMALKPSKNTTIIEVKRDKKKYLGYEGVEDPDIYLNNDQVSRKFIVKGNWKKPNRKYINSVLSQYLRVLEKAHGPVEYSNAEEEELPLETSPSSQKDEVEPPTIPKPNLGPTIGLGLIDKIKTIDPRKQEQERLPQQQDMLRKQQQEEELWRKQEQERAEIQKIERERKESERIERERLKRERIQREKIEREKAELKRQEALELDEFKQNIMHVRPGLVRPALAHFAEINQPEAVFEDSELTPFPFFTFLSSTIAERYPSEHAFSFKISLFASVAYNENIKFLDLLLKYITDGFEDISVLDSDSLPQIFLYEDIEFEWYSTIKTLSLSYQFYDEHYQSQDPSRNKQMSNIDNENASDGSDKQLYLSDSDLLSSNVIIFVFDQDRELSKRRFNPILDVLDKCVNYQIELIIIYLAEMPSDDYSIPSRLSQKEVVETLGIENLIDNGQIALRFLTLTYVRNKAEHVISFTDLKKFFKESFRFLIRCAIMESTMLKEWKFFSFRDISMMICNALKQNLDDDSNEESSEDTKLLRSKLNENTIESYFYLKNYISDLVNCINRNFHEWYERHEYVMREFMSEEEARLFDDVIQAGPKSSRLMEKFFKLDSFNKLFIAKMKQKFTRNYSYSMINDLLSQKLTKYFGQSQDVYLYLDDINQLYENDWNFNDPKGISGNWLVLFQKVYETYAIMLNLNANLNSYVILDGEFSFEINIQELINQSKNDIEKYYLWRNEYQKEFFRVSAIEKRNFKPASISRQMAGSYFSNWKPKELLEEGALAKENKKDGRNDAEESESTRPELFYDDLELEAEIRKK